MSRGLGIGLLSQWHGHPDGSTGARRAFDRKCSADRAYPLPDCEETEAICLLRSSRSKASPIISNVKHQARVLSPECHGSPLGTGMPDHIVERLLCHPKQAESYLSADVRNIAVRSHLYRQPAGSADLIAIDLKRRGKAHVVERGWVEPV